MRWAVGIAGVWERGCPRCLRQRALVRLVGRRVCRGGWFHEELLCRRLEVEVDGGGGLRGRVRGEIGLVFEAEQ